MKYIQEHYFHYRADESTEILGKGRKIKPAEESLRWIKALYKQARKNGSQSIQWTTPNQDKIHLSKNKIEVTLVRTTHQGKVTLGIDADITPNPLQSLT